MRDYVVESVGNRRIGGFCYFCDGWRCNRLLGKPSPYVAAFWSCHGYPPRLFHGWFSDIFPLGEGRGLERGNAVILSKSRIGGGDIRVFFIVRVFAVCRALADSHVPVSTDFEPGFSKKPDRLKRAKRGLDPAPSFF